MLTDSGVIYGFFYNGAENQTAVTLYATDDICSIGGVDCDLKQGIEETSNGITVRLGDKECVLTKYAVFRDGSYPESLARKRHVYFFTYGDCLGIRSGGDAAYRPIRVSW